MAVHANGAIWLFGGYTVAENGDELSTPETFKVDPRANKVYQRKSDMPVPVDDMVALVYQDRYIYLISGWHDVGNVNLVQVYDTQTDRWQQASPWPGAPVFGQSGGIVGNQLLVCGGVYIDYPANGNRDFLLTDACWQGSIRSSDVRRIDWRPAPSMPATGRYRSAAAGTEGQSKRVVFVGGSDNPYNYDGIGYNGVASEPIAGVMSYDLNERVWYCHGNSKTPSMDHRGLLHIDGQQMITIGGMVQAQQVTHDVLSTELGKATVCN